VDIILMKTYLSETQESMKVISKMKNVVFIGQSVKYPGSSIFESLKLVDKKKRIEMPVFEDSQMGMTLGLALEGFFPVSCFPRFDFLILGMNQLINHLDKIDYLSNKKFNGKIYIRTMVGSKKPLDGGPQHTQNLTKGLKKILSTIKIIELKDKKQIKKAYLNNLRSREKIILFVEHGDLYNS
tara:strand:+ start:450 stop:998 length:549 start_codon:yes stop_codon:yes gene_type:complete